MCDKLLSMNTLSTYIQGKPERPMREWAQEFGISRPYLIGLLNGDRSPSLETAQNIAAATGGGVPIESWPKLAALLKAARSAA